MANLKRKISKLFLNMQTEIREAQAMDEQGKQVLSSLANVAERLPSVMARGEGNQMGVLNHFHHLQDHLLQKHFRQLEKLRGYMNQTLEQFQLNVEEMNRLVKRAFEYAYEESDMMLEVVAESGSSRSIAEYLEWMETVLHMYYVELERKRMLCNKIKYSAPAELSSLHSLWPSSSVNGAITHNYGKECSVLYLLLSALTACHLIVQAGMLSL